MIGSSSYMLHDLIAHKKILNQIASSFNNMPAAAMFM